MPEWLKGVLIGVVSPAITVGGALLYNVTLGALVRGQSGFLGGLLRVLYVFETGVLAAGTGQPWVGALAFGLAFGCFAGILVIYDLATILGWLVFVVDLTWSLPNTIFGFIIGNLLYIIFGTPSVDQSRHQGWISYKSRGHAFGTTVLQTLGNVNLGGKGQHERMHLLQARAFGPLYLPLFGLSYVVTTLIQLLWTAIPGLIMWRAKVRKHPYLEPSSKSAVKGFFGWIYYATPFELWAYASGNP